MFHFIYSASSQASPCQKRKVSVLVLQELIFFLLVFVPCEWLAERSWQCFPILYALIRATWCSWMRKNKRGEGEDILGRGKHIKLWNGGRRGDCIHIRHKSHKIEPWHLPLHVPVWQALSLLPLLLGIKTCPVLDFPCCGLPNSTMPGQQILAGDKWPGPLTHIK